MIYDCFSFFNELEILDIRLHELSNVVDKFVLIEATRTFSGERKILYFDKHSLYFDKFIDKIVHVIVDDMPLTREELDACITGKDKKWIQSKYQIEDHWVRERFQRNAMMRVLKDCDPEDIIIISDADEIVRASIVANIKETICEGSNPVEQSLNSYYLNFICTNMPWWGSKIVRRSYLDNATPSEVRFHSPPTSPDCYIKNGGWHYNYFGGAEKIITKIKAFAHQECNVPSNLDVETIEYRLKNKLDVLDRLYEYEVMELTYDNTPKYVIDNLDKFEHFIYHD